jgi:hypothetical protein
MEAKMTTSRVDLVWDKDCPNVEAARNIVGEALGEAGLPQQWTEWEIGEDDLPSYARGFGSPTILVDQRDVTGLLGGECDAACRIYLDEDDLSGVPSVKTVLERLVAERP